MVNHSKKCVMNNKFFQLKLENQKLYYENKIKDMIIKEKECDIDKIIEKKTDININNNFPLKFLNESYPDVITINEFINSFQKCILTDEFKNKMKNPANDKYIISNGIIEIINYHCKQNNIKMFPVICNDTKVRSHKEKTEKGWIKVIDTKNILNIYQIIISKIDTIELHEDTQKIIKLVLQNYDSPNKIKMNNN